MAILSTPPKAQFFTAAGIPLVGGKLYSYDAGTTAPKATYTSESGTQANTNPVILDSRGEANVWLDSTGYKLKLTDANDVEIWTVDNIYAPATQADVNTFIADLAAPSGSSLIGFIGAGSSTVARTVQSKLRDVVSVKDFGALGDGITDDTTAIQTAITAQAGKGLFFPPGVYMVSAPLTMTQNQTTIYGESQGSSIVKRLTGAIITNILVVGDKTGNGIVTDCSIYNMGFDGNSGCTDSVVLIRNSLSGKYFNINVVNGSSHGWRTDTRTSDINTAQVRNEYTSITCRVNGGKGFYFTGEKDARYSNLLSDYNGNDGFYFGAFIDDAKQLAETTQCVLSNLLSRNNGNNGFTFDMIEKYAASSLVSTINAGRGIYFQSTKTGAAAYGSNSIQISSFISRNDINGGIVTDTGAYVSGVVISDAYIVGFNSAVNAPGIYLLGVNRVFFGDVTVIGFNGTAVVISEGTPNYPAPPTTHQSSDIAFSNLYITGNGTAAAASNHGIVIYANSNDIHIGNLISRNNYTTGSNYELTVATSAFNITVGTAVLKSASGSNALSASYGTFLGLTRLESQNFVNLIEDGVPAPTLPTAGSSVFAALYIDSSDGDLKVRFSDGTVKTIVTDT